MSAPHSAQCPQHRASSAGVKPTQNSREHSLCSNTAFLAQLIICASAFLGQLSSSLSAAGTGSCSRGTCSENAGSIQGSCPCTAGLCRHQRVQKRFLKSHGGVLAEATPLHQCSPQMWGLISAGADQTEVKQSCKRSQLVFCEMRALGLASCSMPGSAASVFLL